MAGISAAVSLLEAQGSPKRPAVVPNLQYVGLGAQKKRKQEEIALPCFFGAGKAEGAQDVKVLGHAQH